MRKKKVMKKKEELRGEHLTIIEPNRSWFRVPWRELVRYKDLIFLMVRRDFVSIYKQTVMGPLAYVIQPILNTLVFTIIFGHIAKISTDGLPEPLFYLCGSLGWGYFAGCMSGTSNTFTSNAGIFGKVYFPRLAIPISRVISGLVGYTIQFITFICFWLYYKFFVTGVDFQITSAIVLLPFLLLISAMAGMGTGLWFSSLTAKYRDFGHIQGFITRAWMYGTPVIYPLSIVPEKWRWVAALNPITGVVETFRYAFFGVASVQPYYIAMSITVSAVLLFTGVLMFSITERSFIDTV